MFIDSGFRKNGLASIEYMKKMGITKLRFVVLSHAHKNHLGGAAPIIEQLHPDEIFIPHAKVKDAIARYAVGKAEKVAVASAKYTIMPNGSSFPLGDVTFTRLGPLTIRKCSTGALVENYNSLILRADRGDRHLLLLTGDTSASILAQIDKKNPGCLQAEVLKGPHHNAAQPSSILKKIGAKILAICNSKLPSLLYRSRLKKLGITWFAACKSGSGDFILEDTGTGWIPRKPSEV